MKNSEQLQKEVKEQHESAMTAMMNKNYEQGLIDGELLTITTLKDCMIEAIKSNISIERFIGILEDFDQMTKKKRIKIIRDNN